MHTGYESEVLLRQLDRHLAGLRADGEPADVALAEHLVAALRRRVTETAFASAADRARVRAAVHYFVRRRGDRWARALTEDVRVVGEILDDSVVGEILDDSVVGEILDAPSTV
jgi:hypothetical protein